MEDIFVEVDLPGWKKAKISEFADIVMGQSPPSETYNENGDGLPFFQGKAEFGDVNPSVKKWCTNANKFADQDSILLSVRAPVGAVNIANQLCAIGRGLAAINYNYCHKFLFYYFQLVQQKLDEKGTGTTFRAISGEILRSNLIVLPPLPEQHRIVAKIEELFSSLDKGIEALKTAQAQLKVYRQAVLKWAFEGRLTNPDLKEGELPDGWAMVKLGTIFEVFIGSTPSRKNPLYWGGKINWISSGEVAFCTIFESKEKISDLGLRESSCKLHPPGTVIIAMIGEGKTRGQAAILNCEATHNQNTAAIRIPNDRYLSKLLFYFLTLTYQKNRGIGSGNNQKALNKERIRQFDVPSIPISHQDSLLQSIESRLSVCDKLEADITQSLAKAEALRQSILKKAFEGKLVPQDPNDEPASLLLQRIRKEREAKPAKETKKKAKTTTK